MYHRGLHRQLPQCGACTDSGLAMMSCGTLQAPLSDLGEGPAEAGIGVHFQFLQAQRHHQLGVAIREQPAERLLDLAQAALNRVAVDRQRGGGGGRIEPSREVGTQRFAQDGAGIAVALKRRQVGLEQRLGRVPRRAARRRAGSRRGRG